MSNYNEKDAENYLELEIIKDLNSGRYEKLQTRQPPEPSGYLHLGHVRGILLNYGLAKKYNGICNLRFDDTNPEKENEDFVRGIINDVKWLGFTPNNILYATDYFQANYEVAVKLIKNGLAYVCDLTKDEIAAQRGTLTEAGTNSPYRNRSVEENLRLFEEMKEGKFEQGSRCLRAKTDMAHPNILMRDFVIYRIQYAHHHRIGDTWKIYPTYDFSHPLDDCLEGVSHSMCGSEFIPHRDLYDWVVENSGLKNKSRQVEYYNVNLENVVFGKRHIKELVSRGVVSGFDDPRLHTLAGLRRRGVSPNAILNFLKGIGMGRDVANVDINFFNSFIRDDLNTNARRVMAVLNPVKLIITNYPEGKSEEIEVADFPQNPEDSRKHKHTFERELYIERDDFMENPIPKYFRMFVGNEVRLKGAYIVKCTGFKKDENGDVTEVYAEYDPETKSGGNSTKKVKGTIHFVSKSKSREAEVRLFDNLFRKPNESELNDKDIINGYKIVENSKTIINSLVEDLDYSKTERYQFVRNGYFCLDDDTKAEKLVFNRTISLKDSF